MTALTASSSRMRGSMATSGPRNAGMDSCLSRNDEKIRGTNSVGCVRLQCLRKAPDKGAAVAAARMAGFRNERRDQTRLVRRQYCNAC